MPTKDPFPAKKRRAIQRALLTWYRAHRRELPWRGTRDPYAIWLSEVMLQQTRVETVKPYYAKFLARFPTVAALANAPLDDVLAHWSGLGYYARGRALHASARAICDRHGGALPGSREELAALPGFGPYTSAAVASIAFGANEAVVDGNVARVLTRWTCREGDPRTSTAMAHFRAIAKKLLPDGGAAEWNQAVMELGALVCVPKRPACNACPVRTHCAAHLSGRARELPPPRSAKARPQLLIAAVLVRRDASVLLARRPEAGLFAGLWELPGVELEPKDEPRERLRAAIEARLGLRVRVGEVLARVAQTLTHRELRLTLYEASTRGRARARMFYSACRFADLDDALPGGLSSATRKALRGAALAERASEGPPAGGAPRARPLPLHVTGRRA